VALQVLQVLELSQPLQPLQPLQEPVVRERTMERMARATAAASKMLMTMVAGMASSFY
jgi:hypothetical protein